MITVKIRKRPPVSASLLMLFRLHVKYRPGSRHPAYAKTGAPSQLTLTMEPWQKRRPRNCLMTITELGRRTVRRRAREVTRQVRWPGTEMELTIVRLRAQVHLIDQRRT